MAVWSGTSYFVSPDGSNNLILTEGAGFGSFLSDVITIPTALGVYTIQCRFTGAQDGGGYSRSTIKILIATSEDDATYTDWLPFWPDPVTAYCKYYKFKITMEADLASATLPKITAFEHIAKPFRSNSRQENVAAIMATAPAAPDIGKRYLITTGADADTIQECVDSDTPSYQSTPLQEGQDTWDEGSKQRVIYSDSKQQKPYCLQGRRPLGSVEEVAVVNVAPQTVLEVTWTAGEFADSDEFFVKLYLYTGTNVSGFADLAAIQIDDGTGYTTVWQAGPAGFAQKVLYRVHIMRGLANTECVSIEHATAPASASIQALAATWTSACVGIKVLANGDAGAKANCQIYADKNI